jgi:hypothetical protein
VAVYTEVSDEQLDAFLADYDIGELMSFKGIAEGVENTNFMLHTNRGYFILTLYEKRVDPVDLPFFIGLMEHLRRPRTHLPAAGADANPARRSANSPDVPAAIVTFLEGMSDAPPPGACTVRHVGQAPSPNCTSPGTGFSPFTRRPNALSVPKAGGRSMSGPMRQTRADDGVAQNLSSADHRRRTCVSARRRWPDAPARPASSMPISSTTTSSSSAEPACQG